MSLPIKVAVIDDDGAILSSLVHRTMHHSSMRLACCRSARRDPYDGDSFAWLVAAGVPPRTRPRAERFDLTQQSIATSASPHWICAALLTGMPPMRLSTVDDDIERLEYGAGLDPNEVIYL
jgi:hypothetical protein